MLSVDVFAEGGHHPVEEFQIIFHTDQFFTEGLHIISIHILLIS